MGSWSQEYSGKGLPASYNLSPPVTLKLPLFSKDREILEHPQVSEARQQGKAQLKGLTTSCQFRGGDGSILIKLQNKPEESGISEAFFGSGFPMDCSNLDSKLIVGLKTLQAFMRGEMG